MRRRRFAGMLLGVLLLAGMIPSSAFSNSQEAVMPGPGDPAPLFSADDLDGKKVVLAELLQSGHVILLNFWGLRCGACIEEIGYLNPLYDRYAGKGVMFLGVNVDGVKGDVIRQFMPKMANIPKYRVVPDPDFKIPDAYNLKGAPLSIVIGKDGKIKYRHEDFKPGDEKGLEEALRKIVPAGD